MNNVCSSWWRREPGPGRLNRGGVAALLTLALLAGACGSSNSASYAPLTPSTAAAPQITLGGQRVVVRGRATVSGSLAIEIDDNYFTPNVLSATPGSTITLELANKGKALHNMSEPAEALDHDLPVGATFSATLRVPASGQLLFYCKYHRDESGMVGAVNAT